MNPIHHLSCSQAACPASESTLPPCAGLAVPYVPVQQREAERYHSDEALSNGTLYPDLNLPFHLNIPGSVLPDGPLTELQALEFAVLELGLYLDTHPDDTEAFSLYKQYAAMEKRARESYEAQQGPVFQQSASEADSYLWLREPWPWNMQQNEVK